jgi:tripartite-type tricarboxylate transporter receptor subunit TctC
VGPDYEVDQWFGVWVPAKTAKETVAKLAGWFAAALQTSEIKGKLVAQGLFPFAICGTDFAASLRRKYEEYSRAVRESNIKAE